MKTVLHLVSDKNIGGVRRGIETMINSDLSNSYRFLTNYESDTLPQHIDILIFHDPIGSSSLLRLLKLKLKYPKAKFIIHEHHYSEYYQFFNPFPNSSRFFSIARLCFSLANIVVANSQANANWMFNNKLVSKSKVFVIPSYNSSIQDFLALPSTPPPSSLTFGFYGRTSTQKGVDILLEAIKLNNDSNIKFNIQIMDSSPEAAALRSLIKHEGRVNVFSNINVFDFVSNCDVIIIPSRWEPFGQVCLEAKAAAKPVIVSAVDGLIEQVADKSCGILVPVNDPKRLSQAIHSVSSMPPLFLHRWGLNGRASVCDSLSDFLCLWSNLL